MLSKRNQNRIKFCNICGERIDISVKSSISGSFGFNAVVNCGRCKSTVKSKIHKTRDMAISDAIKLFKSLKTSNTSTTPLDTSFGITYFDNFEDVINAINLGISVEQKYENRHIKLSGKDFNHDTKTISYLQSIGFEIGKVYTTEPFNKYCML